MRYKVGSKVRIKSLDWYNENKDEYGNIDCGNVVFLKSMQRFCGRIVTIIDVNEVQNIYTTVLKKDYLSIENHAAEVMQLNGEMIEGLAEEETNDCEKCGLTRNSIRCLFMDNCPHNKQKNIIEIPKDYVIKDENGNVINTTKIVLEKKKKEYPKTYTECSDILSVYTDPDISGYKGELLWAFQKLLVCRDAYWKIAGEEMGLGKPWEPNEADYVTGRYCIFVHRGNIICSTPAEDCPLTFPTEEMRDAFYENFKELIESVKELL